jgi:uncharacterized membrane protein
MRFTWPGFVAFSVFVVVLAATVYALVRGRRGRPLPWYIIALRGAALLLLFLIIFQPSIVFYESKNKPAVALLIDTSYSMNFAGRIRGVSKTLERERGALGRDFNLDAYAFDSTLRPLKDAPSGGVPPQADFVHQGGLKAGGKSTAIGTALLQATADRAYDAVIIFSDGINNAGAEPEEVARNPGVPVFTVRPADAGVPKDVSITDVKSGDFVFKNIPAEVHVSFRANGLLGKEASVYLKKGKEIVASKKKVIDAPEQEVALPFTSSRLGQDVYTVEITPFPEETVTENNYRDFTVETVREKIRVLYICGQPGYEYYFLRHFIKTNPTMELVSFVILRNPENVAVVPEEQLSLIPFPAREIFMNQLFEYDIVILENFAYAKFYITGEYLASVAKFVKEKGGSLLMIGGDTGLGRGGYAGTAVEEILPVKLDRPDEPVMDGLFRPRLIDVLHPVAMLGETTEDTRKIWENIPMLEGRQKIVPKPWATVIADDPGVKVDGSNAAVIACGEAGKGRTMVIAPDTTWRWQMGGGQYQKFWENALYWLSSGEATKKFRVSIMQKKYFPGDDVSVRIITLGRQTAGRTPVVTVTDPMSKSMYMERVIRAGEGWTASFIPSIEGKYTVKAWIEAGGRITARDEKALAVSPEESAEEADLRENSRVMDSVAALSGGRSYTLKDFSPDSIAPFIKKRIRPSVSRQINLAAEFWMLLPVIGLLAAEWALRRIN